MAESASASWQWVPYPTAVATVSGGTRWGGGQRISTRDEACFGHLLLRQGRWGSRQVVPSDWVRQATARGPVGPDYGYLWWLNTEKHVKRELGALS